MPRKPSLKKRKTDDEDIDDRSSDGSDDGADLEGFIIRDEEGSEGEEENVEESEDAALEAAVEESRRITANLSSSVVGGRSLRNRETIKKPTYFFDAENFAKIQEMEDKKEKIQMLKSWAASGEYVCPILKSLTKKSESETVEEEYRKAKRALDIPDTDDEEDEEEESEEPTEEEDDEFEEEEEEEEEDDEEDEETEEEEDDSE
jgi:hypothetical protein